MSAAAPSGDPARAERLAGELRADGLDALLVTSPIDVRYVTGFTGTHGLALIAAARGARHLFLTDFRYATQSAAQVPDSFERRIVSGGPLDAAIESLGEPLGQAGGRVGFDETALTVREHTRAQELIAPGWELVGCAGVVARLRQVKEPAELERIRAASELADQAMREVLEAGIVGRTERDVAIELELRMRRLGAERPSFQSIVAAGEHSALPHAEPRDAQIVRDVLVTIDWGAVHEGYCSDCTRTYATGEGISAEAREIYELVRAAQAGALQAVRAGLSGRELDAIAREVIERAGHGREFGHGLGHGVGLDIHEPPRLSRTAGDEPLACGNVVTLEPGVYLPGRFGVRIEDLVVVREDGGEVLSGLPKELTVVC